jgi:hypothetical protein
MRQLGREAQSLRRQVARGAVQATCQIRADDSSRRRRQCNGPILCEVLRLTRVAAARRGFEAATPGMPLIERPPTIAAPGGQKLVTRINFRARMVASADWTSLTKSARVQRRPAWSSECTESPLPHALLKELSAEAMRAKATFAMLHFSASNLLPPLSASRSAHNIRDSACQRDGRKLFGSDPVRSRTPPSPYRFREIVQGEGGH